MSNKKIKVKINKDEWYPVYSFDNESWGEYVEIDIEKYKQMKKVFEEFYKVQKELRNIYNDKI